MLHISIPRIGFEGFAAFRVNKALTLFTGEEKIGTPIFRAYILAEAKMSFSDWLKYLAFSPKIDTPGRYTEVLDPFG